MLSRDPSLGRERTGWKRTMPRRKKQSKASRGQVVADDDGRLFRSAMSDARRLEIDTVESPRRRPRASARFSRLDQQDVLRESLEAPAHAMEIANGSALSYRHPSVNLKTMRRLARGGISVQAEMDLHGLTSAEAEESLRGFVAQSILRGHTCVRIVHGKGLRSGQKGPVLKREVDRWLRRWEPVLAFVSARQADGGTGAVYVLLKKNA
jgi:DNA-nicking Smr family endonuclease